MKVGIDLSSTNTGLVILSDDNKLVWHGNFKLWDNNRFTIACNVEEMLSVIKCKYIGPGNIYIGVELADFKNANITNRFNLLTGIIISELRFLSYDIEIKNENLKLFNSNEWQSLLAKEYSNCVNRYEKDKKIYYDFYHCLNKKIYQKIVETFDSKRSLLKALSRDFTMYRCIYYQDTWTEDECDAYCIAYFLPQLRDRTQMHQEVKAKKVQAKKSKLAEKNEQIKKWRKENKLRQRQNKYLNILASGKKLTKAQDRALDNAVKELKEMENENHKR